MHPRHYTGKRESISYAHSCWIYNNNNRKIISVAIFKYDFFFNIRRSSETRMRIIWIKRFKRVDTRWYLFFFFSLIIKSFIRIYIICKHRITFLYAEWRILPIHALYWKKNHRVWWVRLRIIHAAGSLHKRSLCGARWYIGMYLWDGMKEKNRTRQRWD